MKYHLLREGGEWQLREEGATEALFSADTKKEAIDKLQDYMEPREGSVLIHKADGEFQEQRDYNAASSWTSAMDVTKWSIVGVAAVAAITAVAVVYYYRDSLPTERLRWRR